MTETSTLAAAGARFVAAALAALGLAAALALPAPAHAQSGDASATVRTAVETWLKGRYKVEEVRRTPLPGIYEVRIGNDLVYVDEKGQHAFVEGNLVDIKSGRNLTRERVDELMTINFKDLPLNIAIKQVIGNGKRQIAIFEDPNCGYCKRMRADLLALKDVTIYTYVISILSPDSETKAKKALCAGDKVRAWNDLMTNGKVPDNAGTCDNQLVKVRELAQKLGISATPTAFFANGKRLQGYVPGPQLDKMLEENSKS
jgi:thiol:disulfide interchange protein DsbC